MKQHCEIVMREGQDGWEMLIRVKPVNIKPSLFNGRYTLVDINRVSQMKVDCGGIKKRPRMILKLECKLSNMEKKGVIKQIALGEARAGSPMLH